MFDTCTIIIRTGVTCKTTVLSTTFICAFIDSGAEKSVIGTNQAHANHASMGRAIGRVYKQLTFRSVEGETKQGTLKLRLDLSNGSHIPNVEKIVHADIPLLIGIEILHRYKFRMDFGQRIIW